MNAKLIVEGKEFDIQIMDPELQKLIRPPKKNGYERVDLHGDYWIDDGDGSVSVESEEGFWVDDNLYNTANYYSDKTVAENNARADKLMRQLRRFAVEHRENDLNWRDNTYKWHIGYDYHLNALSVHQCCSYKHAGDIYFDTLETANKAVAEFSDELIWLFTKYKDSP